MATEGNLTSITADGGAPPPVPDALTVLVATAVGGVLGSRLGAGKPLAVAACATTLAWLSRKKPGVIRPQATIKKAELEPPQAKVATQFPPVEVTKVTEEASDTRVEDWLARQIDREERAAAGDSLTGEMPLGWPALAAHETPEAVPEDDYAPQSLLLENAEEEPVMWQGAAFTALMEPRQVPTAPSWPPPAPAITPPVESRPPPPAVFEAPPEPVWRAEPQPVFSAPWPAAQSAAATFAATSPIQGIEPLPSWTEQSLPPIETSAPAAPHTPEVELESLFNIPLHQGASVPDEVQVAPTEVPTPAMLREDPMAMLFKPYETVEAGEAAPAAAKVPEIAVHVAAPGDAWFDEPLAGVPNPWAPPVVEEAERAHPFPAMPPSNAPKAVIDAEIVLRPRAPFQASVVSKAPPPVPAPVANEPDPVAKTEDDLPCAPVKSPREQRARSTWRSWWRGD